MLYSAPFLILITFFLFAGGFLAQKFAEYTYQYSRVASLILCNTFLDTSIFDYNDSAMMYMLDTFKSDFLNSLFKTYLRICLI